MSDTQQTKAAVFVGDKRVTGSMPAQEAKRVADDMQKRNSLREGNGQSAPKVTVRSSLQG